MYEEGKGKGGRSKESVREWAYEDRGLCIEFLNLNWFRVTSAEFGSK